MKRQGASYFVTFRLADSLPKEVLLQFEREKAERLRRLNDFAKRGKAINDSEEEISRDFRRKIERCLDRGSGAGYLRRPDIADVGANAMRHFHESRYLLQEWVVMPNHVHSIVWPMPNHLLGDILKSWKQFTSRRAKKIVGMGEEPFWQPESYDHWIRTGFMMLGFGLLLLLAPQMLTNPMASILVLVVAVGAALATAKLAQPRAA